MHSFLSRTIWSILSSALKTTSVPELLSRLFSFMRTVAELRPPRLYSVLQHDHRVLALHDDVAGANFLGDFHGVIPECCLGCERRGGRAW